MTAFLNLNELEIPEFAPSKPPTIILKHYGDLPIRFTTSWHLGTCAFQVWFVCHSRHQPRGRMDWPWACFCVLSQMTRARSQPVWDDVTYVMSSLIGWRSCQDPNRHQTRGILSFFSWAVYALVTSQGFLRPSYPLPSLTRSIYQLTYTVDSASTDKDLWWRASKKVHNLHKDLITTS